MSYGKISGSLRGLSVGSLIFGELGVYWWVLLGMVFGLAGLMFGFVDWTTARRRSLDYRLSIMGVLLPPWPCPWTSS
jgi:hypothetical protein